MTVLEYTMNNGVNPVNRKNITQTGKIYHGFRLVEQTQIEEIRCLARRFVHEKTRAGLIHLENDDENRMFLIGFRTPPSDDTGVFHIIEHSVLGGSRKFPCKEPFVELLKGSLHTFINAMTGNDSTIYPVATKNEKDYFNLMNVYLDAVFHPLIYERRETFLQEGWHYHIENTDDEIVYKGVVYNEMKGESSSPESLLDDLSTRSLFPDTVYRFDSGGKPENITKLTYRQFLEYHRKYYHPSNSYIILYGQGSLMKQLKFIQEQYLKDFSHKEVSSSIDYQIPFKKTREVTGCYPITAGENTQDKTYFCSSIVTGTFDKPLVNVGLSILMSLLVNSEAAPLRHAILNAEAGKDVYGWFSKDREPVWSLIVKNSNLNQKEKIKKIIDDTLGELLETGIDVQQIESEINSMEFSLKEADYGGFSRGLVYSYPIMDNWLHDKDPFVYLRFTPILAELRKKSKERYFEQLIKNYLLDNLHSSFITLLPRPGMETEREKKVRGNLAEYKNSLTKTELRQLVIQTQNLMRKQGKPDTEEALKTIPLLNLADIDKKSGKIPQEVETSNTITTLTHPLTTNGITYMSMFFDTRGVSLENIPYLKLLSTLLGKVDTKNYSYSELDNEMGIHLGAMGFGLGCFATCNDEDKIYPRLMMASKLLYSKTVIMRELLEEILLTSKFDDKQRIIEIVKRVKSRIEMAIMSSGLASTRAMSYLSKRGMYVEMIGGISYYKFIADLERNIEERFPRLIEILADLQTQVFNRRNLVISLTAEKESMLDTKRELDKLTAYLANRRQTTELPNIQTPEYIREGFHIPAETQFVTKGGYFSNYGIEYSGCMHVMKEIVNLNYLWNNIRVKGGAYGCSMMLKSGGSMLFSSQRDPNLSESLDIFDGCGEFIREFRADEREMRKAIIGTISKHDRDQTPSMKGNTMTGRYLTGNTPEDVQQERDEVLSTKVSDINALAEMLNLIMQENKICVVGSETAIRAEEEIFDKIDSILE